MNSVSQTHTWVAEGKTTVDTTCTVSGDVIAVTALSSDETTNSADEVTDESDVINVFRLQLTAKLGVGASTSGGIGSRGEAGGCQQVCT